MEKFKAGILFVIGLGIILTCFAFTSGTAGRASQANPSVIPPTQDVRVVNKPTESIPVTAQGTTTIAGNVSISNLPGTFFQVNTRYNFTLAEGSGNALINCVVQEIRGYWLRCNGQIRRASAPPQPFNSWVNANFIIAVN
ncbi:MAG TPA: hypothetical protein VFB82_23730 [Blastocatellia bacterium]|jgi:hypothetical protein|nr:hypothetical protein [Blastocatellia bacterium]